MTWFHGVIGGTAVVAFLVIFVLPVYAVCSGLILYAVADRCRSTGEKAPVRVVLWVIGGPITLLAWAVCHVAGRIDWRRW